MNLTKHGLVFWFASTSIMLFLFGCPQIPTVEGLECPVCIRFGEFGSKSCEPMPCNSKEDVRAAVSRLGQGISLAEKEFWQSRQKADHEYDHEHRHYYQKHHDINPRLHETPTKFLADHVATDDDGSGSGYICAKFIGRGYWKDDSSSSGSGTKIRLPVTLGVCRSSPKPWPYDDKPFPLPRTKPYTEVPRELYVMLSEVVKPGSNPRLHFDALYVCDEGNQASCRISEQELQRSGAVYAFEPPLLFYLPPRFYWFI